MGRGSLEARQRTSPSASGRGGHASDTCRAAEASHAPHAPAALRRPVGLGDVVRRTARARPCQPPSLPGSPASRSRCTDREAPAGRRQSRSSPEESPLPDRPINLDRGRRNGSPLARRPRSRTAPSPAGITRHRRSRHGGCPDGGGATCARRADHDPLDLVDGDRVRGPVVELRCLRRRVPRDLLRVLEGPSVRQNTP